jgi:inner membrane protein
MPSPAGHALAAVAAGWIVRGTSVPARSGPYGFREAALFAALGVAPDLDLLVGIHSGPTHGLGVAVLAAAAAWLPGLAGPAAGSRLALAVACVFAYASHTLLDWLGSDTSPPIGIMALWPFTRDYYESGFHVFMAVSRRFRQPELFWVQNFVALARELVILVPIVAAVWIVRQRTPRGLRPAQQPESERQRQQRHGGQDDPGRREEHTDAARRARDPQAVSHEQRP